MGMKNYVKASCTSCRKSPLSKDEIGISKKLLGEDTGDCYCLECLASYLEISVEEIREKIEAFKEDGCTLFQ